MKFKPSIQLSFGEEIGNSVSHGVGALVMLVLQPITAIYSYTHFGLKATVGMSILVFSLLLMFLSSTIYHSMSFGSPHKYVMRIIDHSAIYIAIAGCYTPVALSLVGGWLGIVIIVLQWSITLYGILYKVLAKNVNEKFSLFLYLFMGWLVVFILPYMVRLTNITFLSLMVIGGLLYTIGALFYAKKRPYFHFIWHLFIFFAAITHYIAIVYFML